MGIAGITTSVNGATPPALVGSDGGGWAWYDDGVIFGQADFGAGYSTYTLQLSPEVLTLVSTGEISESSAGGTNWATFTTGVGVLTDVGGLGPFPNGGLAEVSETGQLALIADRANDLGIQVYSAAGTLQSSVNAIPIPSHGIFLRGDVLSYEDADGWHLRTGSTGAVLPFVGQVDAVSWMVPVVDGSTIYVLERSATTPNEPLTIRRSTDGTSLVIKNDGIGYNPDARMIGTNLVRVVYSTTAGEAATDLVVHDVNLVTGAHEMGTVVGGVVVFTTQPTIPSSQLPTTGGSAAARIALTGLYNQPLLRKGDRKGGEPLIDERWYKALLSIAGFATAPVDLSSSSQVTGVLDQTNGGTSNDQGMMGGTSNSITALTGDVEATGPGSVEATIVQQYVPMTTGAIPGEILFVGADVMLVKTTVP